MYGDGKVITPRFKGKPGDPPRLDRRTGELRQRPWDPDAGYHVQGGEDGPVWGSKYVFMMTRHEAPHSRLILDVQWVKKTGGEAAVAMKSVALLRPLLPGALGIVYDKALRGKHKQELLHQHGLLPIIAVTAKRRAQETPQGVIPKVPKDAHIEDKEVRLRDGTTRLCRVHAVDGAAGLAEQNIEGDPVFIPLKRGRIRRTETEDGTSRWYGHYELPEVLGAGGTLTLRLDQTSEDRQRGLNRTEVLSPIPRSDPDYVTLSPLRSDAESSNSALEDRLYRGRAHSVGHLGQRASLLGYALLVNSLTLYFARRRGDIRERPPPDELAA